MDLLMQNFTLVFGALVSLLMFLSGHITALNKINKDLIARSFAIGIVLAVGFISKDIMTIDEALIGFIVQAYTYDKVLEPRGLKTKK